MHSHIKSPTSLRLDPPSKISPRLAVNGFTLLNIHVVELELPGQASVRFAAPYKTAQRYVCSINIHNTLYFSRIHSRDKYYPNVTKVGINRTSVS